MSREMLAGLVLSCALVMPALVLFAPTICRVSKPGVTRSLVQRLDRDRLNVEFDIDRPVVGADWPSLLLANTNNQSGWNGPYVRPSMLRDIWGGSMRLAPGLGVYSMGLDGRDDQGQGDDIPSWKQFDGAHYRRAGEWVSLFTFTGIVVGLLTSIFVRKSLIRRSTK